MAEYRLTRGKHFVKTSKGIVHYVKGDVVELTENQAAAFADRFEPVDGEEDYTPPIDVPDGAEESEWAGIHDMNVAEVEELITEIDDVDDLTAIGDTEATGKGRKSVYAAIKARVEELQAAAEE